VQSPSGGGGGGGGSSRGGSAGVGPLPASDAGGLSPGCTPSMGLLPTSVSASAVPGGAGKSPKQPLRQSATAADPPRARRPMADGRAVRESVALWRGRCVRRRTSGQSGRRCIAAFYCAGPDWSGGSAAALDSDHRRGFGGGAGRGPRGHPGERAPIVGIRSHRGQMRRIRPTRPPPGVFHRSRHTFPTRGLWISFRRRSARLQKSDGAEKKSLKACAGLRILWLVGLAMTQRSPPRKTRSVGAERRMARALRWPELLRRSRYAEAAEVARRMRCAESVDLVGRSDGNAR
jgi:hypothetical protein